MSRRGAETHEKTGGTAVYAAVLVIKALGGGWSVPEAHGVNSAILNHPTPSWEENAP